MTSIVPVPPGTPVIGVGVDAVDIARYRSVLIRTPSLADRTFTVGELEYARRQQDPTQRLAARFAAKEATLKAFGVGLGACRFHDLEVVRDPHGRPALVLHGAARELAADRGVATVMLTLTHTEIVSIAFVVAVGHPS